MATIAGAIYRAAGFIATTNGITIIAGGLTVTAGNVVIANGAFYQAKRNTFSSLVNVLGFALGTDTLVTTVDSLYELRDTGDVPQVVFNVAPGGGITINNGAFFRAKRSTGSVPLTLLGFASGTDTLVTTITDTWELRDTGGTARVAFSQTGGMWLGGAAPTVAAGRVGLGSTVQTTVGPAGGASALPATPRGYLIINVAGTARVLPYYDQA